jgi:hypothetical protein
LRCRSWRSWLRRSRVPFVPAWLGGFLLMDHVFPMVFPWYLAMSQHRFLPSQPLG